jgi:hydrogenase maturation protease
MKGTLVAGVGNIFLSDDAFGVEVAARLATRSLPEHVTVRDFGIRGMHLAYELLEGWERLILVDAMPRGGAPGTVYVLEPDDVPPGGPPDAHSMHPMAVFGTLAAIGGTRPPTLIVGCEPASLEDGMGLSEPVERAVDEAVDVVLRLAGERIIGPEGNAPALAGSERRSS